MTPVFVAALVSVWLAAAPPGPARDRVFWVSLAQNRFEVPPGESAYGLLVEMNDLLGSTDPVLRDDVAYGAAARWMYRERRLTAGQQKHIVGMWTSNLSAGIGEAGTDSVFRRSFSALNLSIAAAADLQAPFLSQAEFDNLLAAALTYFARERDTRGYDAVKGWMHTPAHTADLLKFLARNPKLPISSQSRLLNGVAEKCAAVGHTWAWGEGERLAQVVRSIVRRADFDAQVFEAWVGNVDADRKALWARAPAIDPARFPAVQNTLDVLRATFVALSGDSDLPPAAVQARSRLLELLAGS